MKNRLHFLSLSLAVPIVVFLTPHLTPHIDYFRNTRHGAIFSLLSLFLHFRLTTKNVFTITYLIQCVSVATTTLTRNRPSVFKIRLEEEKGDCGLSTFRLWKSGRRWWWGDSVAATGRLFTAGTETGVGVRVSLGICFQRRTFKKLTQTVTSYYYVCFFSSWTVFFKPIENVGRTTFSYSWRL